MGGSFGVALFSAVLIARLDQLIALLPGAGMLGANPAVQLLRAGPDALASMPAGLRGGVAAAMTDAFHSVFWLGAGIAVLTFFIILCLREIPLRTSSGPASPSPAEKAVATVEKTSPGASVGAPAD